MKPSLEEQETIIRIDRLSNTAEIYTSDSRYINKFDKLVEKNPDEWKFTRQDVCDGDVTGKFYQCPVNLLTFRSKTKTVEMTEEQRAAASKRMKEMLERKKS